MKIVTEYGNHDVEKAHAQDHNDTSNPELSTGPVPPHGEDFVHVYREHPEAAKIEKYSVQNP